MHLFDTLSLEHALSLPLDHHVRRLLRERVDHLTDETVRDCTYFLVVDAGSTLDDVCDELGWSPIHDLNGERFGTPAFTPFHDYLVDHGGWFELLIGAGNDAMFTLLIEDSDRIDPDLLALCRAYAH
jgi:hypothetical protein